MAKSKTRATGKSVQDQLDELKQLLGNTVEQNKKLAGENEELRRRLSGALKANQKLGATAKNDGKDRGEDWDDEDLNRTMDGTPEDQRGDGVTRKTEEEKEKENEILGAGKPADPDTGLNEDQQKEIGDCISRNVGKFGVFGDIQAFLVHVRGEHAKGKKVILGTPARTLIKYLEGLLK